MPTQSRSSGRSTTAPRPPRDRSGDRPETWNRADGIEPATYTVPEAAARLGIGLKLAYEMVRTGAIPSIRLGHKIKVSRVVLETMLSGGA
jgi:excisionase family DNA binding protein